MLPDIPRHSSGKTGEDKIVKSIIAILLTDSFSRKKDLPAMTKTSVKNKPHRPTMRVHRSLRDIT